MEVPLFDDVLERHHCRYNRHHAKLPQVENLDASASGASQAKWISLRKPTYTDADSAPRQDLQSQAKERLTAASQGQRMLCAVSIKALNV